VPLDIFLHGRDVILGITMLMPIPIELMIFLMEILKEITLAEPRDRSGPVAKSAPADREDDGISREDLRRCQADVRMGPTKMILDEELGRLLERAEEGLDITPLLEGPLPDPHPDIVLRLTSLVLGDHGIGLGQLGVILVIDIDDEEPRTRLGKLDDVVGDDPGDVLGEALGERTCHGSTAKEEE
jgi:hypothetical protein